MKKNYVYEEWRPVKGYEGLYEVSNFGRVKSLDRKVLINNTTNNYSCERFFKGKIMKQRKDRLGYLRISLCKKGKYKLVRVHRLVAEAFIPNPNNYPQINHKSEIKTKNFVWQLEWCTAQYNVNYGTANERRINTRDIKKLYHHRKPVCQYTIDKKLIKIFPSAKETGYNRESIRDCCQGKQKTAYGYIWRYLD